MVINTLLQMWLNFPLNYKLQHILNSPRVRICKVLPYYAHKCMLISCKSPHMVSRYWVKYVFMRSLGFPFFFLLCNYCTSGCKESCQHWHWHKIGFMHLWMHFSLYITVMAWVYMFAKTSPIMCLWAMLIQFYSAECFPIH